MTKDTPFSINQGFLQEPPPTEIWVRKTDDPNRLARDIIAEILEYEFIDLACIGAATINQAVKAVAICRDKHRNIAMIPYFSTVIDEDKNEKTRMMLRVYLCRESGQS